MKRANWLKNTIGAIIVIPLFAALAGCGGGITTELSGTGGTGGGGTGGGGSVAGTSATLSWVAPAVNEDGTPADDLAGYIIWMGTSSQTYTAFIDVGNSTTYSMADLDANTTYYYAITAYDTSGNESNYSTEVIL